MCIKSHISTCNSRTTKTAVFCKHAASSPVGEIGGEPKPMGLVKPYCGGMLLLCGATEAADHKEDEAISWCGDCDGVLL